MNATRPSWNDYYLGIASAASLRSDCRRSKVGAVIVLRGRYGHSTSLGYVGVEPGAPGCLSGACPRGLMTYSEFPSDLSDYSNCISTHAEINAFYNAQFGVEFADVYVTRKPCDDCQLFLFREGVSAFHWPGGKIDAQSYANLPDRRMYPEGS